MISLFRNSSHEAINHLASHAQLTLDRRLTANNVLADVLLTVLLIRLQFCELLRYAEP
jgi:hypothetical protein